MTDEEALLPIFRDRAIVCRRLDIMKPFTVSGDFFFFYEIDRTVVIPDFIIKPLVKSLKNNYISFQKVKNTILHHVRRRIKHQQIFCGCYV